MTRLAALVLGSAAGGGFPQWNCRCPTCQLAWAGDRRVRPRTQTSLAVSGDGETWVLINASPDLSQQIRHSQALHPSSEASRGSPIKAVVLTGAEIDQAVGVLSLRERQPFTLYATPATHAALADNPMYGVLSADLVVRQAVMPGEPIALPGRVQAELFMVPGKVPLYLEGADPDTDVESAANVGIELVAAGARIAFVPGAAAITSTMRERIDRADVVFFDGTLFRDDEMLASGTGSKTGRRMGHMPITGEGGSLAALDAVRGRRIYLHINNTNPILIDGSPERREVEWHGWEVAEDGMKIVL